MKRNKKKNKISEVLYRHISSNSKEYIIVTLLFVIGILFGVLFINNMEESQNSDIFLYYKNFVEKIKTVEKINIFLLIKDSIIRNLLLGLILCFFGTTLIGIPVVFGIIIYRGFCLGYTISTIISVSGIGSGLIQALSLLLLQNLLYIPSIIAIAVSGFKLYKSIVKDKNKNNIKLEILRHIIFSGLMLGILCLSAVVEVVISTNIFRILL